MPKYTFMVQGTADPYSEPEDKGWTTVMVIAQTSREALLLGYDKIAKLEDPPDPQVIRIVQSINIEEPL